MTQPIWPDLMKDPYVLYGNHLNTGEEEDEPVLPDREDDQEVTKMDHEASAEGQSLNQEGSKPQASQEERCCDVEQIGVQEVSPGVAMASSATLVSPLAGEQVGDDATVPVDDSEKQSSKEKKKGTRP